MDAPSSTVLVGEIMTISGMGMPKKGGHGELLVKFEVDMPDKYAVRLSPGRGVKFSDARF